jgi:peptidoglycan hydrolase-like amidase
LTNQARFLRNASPKAYDDFLAAFTAYTEAAAATLVVATENWQLYQGHAQQCLKIMKALEEAKNG